MTRRNFKTKSKSLVIFISSPSFPSLEATILKSFRWISWSISLYLEITVYCYSWSLCFRHYLYWFLTLNNEDLSLFLLLSPWYTHVYTCIHVYISMTKYVWFRAEPGSKTITILPFHHDSFALKTVFFFFHCACVCGFLCSVLYCLFSS